MFSRKGFPFTMPATTAPALWTSTCEGEAASASLASSHDLSALAKRPARISARAKASFIPDRNLVIRRVVCSSCEAAGASPSCAESSFSRTAICSPIGARRTVMLGGPARIRFHRATSARSLSPRPQKR